MGSCETLEIRQLVFHNTWEAGNAASFGNTHLTLFEAIYGRGSSVLRNVGLGSAGIHCEDWHVMCCWVLCGCLVVEVVGRGESCSFGAMTRSRGVSRVPNFGGKWGAMVDKADSKSCRLLGDGVGDGGSCLQVS